jgi:hypothetical protein
MLFVSAGGDPDVPSREFCAKRMMRLVEPSAIKVVAKLLDNQKAVIQLRQLGERATQAVVAGEGLLGNGVHDRQQFAPEFGKKRADGRCRHTLLGGIDQRIGNMLIGRKKTRIFTAKINGLFQERPHGSKVVRRSRPCPGIIRGRAERAGPGDIGAGDFDRLFEVAAGDPYQASLIGLIRQTSGIWRKFVE